MKIQKFNENASTIIDDIKDKYVGEETYYVLYGVKLYDKDGKLYPRSNINAEKIIAQQDINKIPHWYDISKKNYDELFVKKEYVKTEVLSQDELDLLLKSGKYNL